MDYNVFELIPECVDDRDKLKNILYFLFSAEKIKANTILAAQDAGIVNKLLAVKAINLNFWHENTIVLMNDYGISAYYASWAISYWIYYYGVEVLGKHVHNNVLKEVLVFVEKENKSDLLEENTPPRAVRLLAYNEGEKLPQQLIEWDAKEGKKRGIIRFRCTVLRGADSFWDSHIKITGGFWAKGNPGSTKFLFMVYNNFDELIGLYQYHVYLYEESGKQTLSFVIEVPSFEAISRIRVKVIN